jgi:hypothetical protein
MEFTKRPKSRQLHETQSFFPNSAAFLGELRDKLLLDCLKDEPGFSEPGIILSVVFILTI